MLKYTEDMLQGGRLLPLVEDFYTIQGEGFNTGKAAYFIRLGGCDVGCRWCDARFTWNPRHYPPVPVESIVERAMACAAHSIVITGGEPTLYPLEILTSSLKEKKCEIFIETSGTNPLRGYFDWVCLSPKRHNHPMAENLLRADELKVIIEGVDDLLWAEECAERTATGCILYLQAEWSKFEHVTPLIVEYVKKNPRWRVSLQTHKFMHIP
jgi:7-carboxy-7-deazaguanine synthase